MRSTFSGYYIAKQALAVSRAQLEITGQNISNVGTEGYTRQRVDTYAVGSLAGSSKYAGAMSDFIGNGTDVSSYSQSRDPYLDLRYREENSKYGNTKAQLEGLTEVGYVFDSTTIAGLNSQLENVVKQLEQLSGSPKDPATQGIVKSSVESLTQLLNQYSSQLDTAKNDIIGSLRDGAVRDVNNALYNIAQLNKQIKSANVSGDPALELNDKRNVLIDNLSTYLNIKVTTNKVDIGGGVTVDELSIGMKAPNRDTFNLVDDGDYSQLDFILKNDNEAQIQLLDSKGNTAGYSTNGSITLNNGDVTDYIANGAVRGYIDMINGRGTFSDDVNDTKGIPYFQELLDQFTNKFATALNAANSTDTEDKPLFESGVAGEAITAGNIKLSEEWLNHPDIYITNTKTATTDTEKKTDNSNILYMISLFENPIEFKSDGGTKIFNGTFQEYATNISTELGLSKNNVENERDVYQIGLDDIETGRKSTSGVTVNEESVNMIMYNQAFAAASRFMTTIDETLETIITKMGLVGR